eukprot:620107-Pyramimonas_sp.AAC.2
MNGISLPTNTVNRYSSKDGMEYGYCDQNTASRARVSPQAQNLTCNTAREIGERGSGLSRSAARTALSRL